jgi:hypothetical protein
MPQPTAAAHYNIYSPAAGIQNEFSQLKTLTWVQACDTLVCMVKLKSVTNFNTNADFLA